MSGIFCKEQAAALAECTDCRIVVADWGQDDGALSCRELGQTARALYWRASARKRMKRTGERFWECFEPTLIWSPRLPGGGALRILAALRRIGSEVRRGVGRIDLVHAHVSVPGGYLANILSSKWKVPYVLTEHMSPFPFADLVVAGRPVPMVERAIAGAAAVISVSRFAKTELARFGYSRVSVIPNMVDERQFVPVPTRSGKFSYFTLGGMVKQKGIDVLLRAIAQWAPSPDSVDFVIGGDGPEKGRYEQLAEKLGVARLIRWAGAIPREAVPSFFQDCHAFVLPSRHESFGVVLAEAIACGRPVIATRCGGPEDIVTEENGVLVAPDNPTELACALRKMVETHRDYSPDVIREGFLERFSRPVVAGQIRKLYSKVLSGCEDIE